jgi:ACS family glucarate transporter-like MFS transporter/ACS family D-galactonate transporter-like MFS transporter
VKVGPTWVRWRVLVWLTLAAALAYLCRNTVGVAESTIRDDLGLTLRQSGWFMGAFFWTYAIFQVPGGWIAHRWGTRLALAVFALGWGIASILLGLAPAFWLLLVAQLIMGTAQAGVFPASCNSISHWMPLARRSLSCGILATGMQVGAIVSSWLAAILLVTMGWRWVFILFAIPSLLWAIGFLLRFRNDPERDPAVNEAELELIRPGKAEEAVSTEMESHEATPWVTIVSNPVLWLLCGQQICRAAGYMFYASWFPTFLQETRDISVSNSGFLQALVFGATLAGSLCGGLLVDWIWKRSGSLRLSRGGVGALFLGLCGALILGAFLVHRVEFAVALLTAGAFCAAVAGPCAFSSTIDIGGRHIPQVFGIMNMSGNFAAAATPVVVGYLFDWSENWNLVLVLFAVVFFVGSLCFVFVDPTRKVRS